MRVCALILSAALWLAPAQACSQGTDGDGVTVRGLLDAHFTAGLTVQLYDIARHVTLATSEIAADGAFELCGAAAGSYFVTVTDRRGAEIYHGNATLGSPGLPPLVIHVTEREPAQPISGAVSVRQLQHPLSRKAYSAMVQSERQSEAGDYAKAAASLERAIAISPDFADAHTNLGAQYLRLGRFADAAAETERAIALDGPNAPRLCNLAFAQMHLGDNAGALESVRAALRLAPGDAHAQYIIGFVLYLNRGPRNHARRARPVRATKVSAISAISPV
jgi:tetratricopeptide (TPR) repeat protein